MAYSHTNSKGVTYYLHKTEVTLRGGKPQTIYFFAKVEKNAKGEPVDLPEDRIVKENPRNGFLTVSKKKTEDQYIQTNIQQTPNISESIFVKTTCAISNIDGTVK